MDHEEVEGSTTLDRRRFLAQAAVAGGTIWAIPTLISAGPAGAAQLTSPPPDNPPPDNPPPENPPPQNPPSNPPTQNPPGPGGSTPGSPEKPPTDGWTEPGEATYPPPTKEVPHGPSGPEVAAQDASPGARSLTDEQATGLAPQELAQTGSNLDRLAGSGLAAIAAGGALVHWSAKRTAVLADDLAAQPVTDDGFPI